MTDGFTALGEAFLAASQLREATEDLSAQEINRLPMADYAKIRERAGLPAADPFAEAYAPEPPGRPREAPAPTQTAPPAPGPIDVQAMGMQEYKQLRDRLGIGRSASDRGLFDGNHNESR